MLTNLDILLQVIGSYGEMDEKTGCFYMGTKAVTLQYAQTVMKRITFQKELCMQDTSSHNNEKKQRMSFLTLFKSRAKRDINRRPQSLVETERTKTVKLPTMSDIKRILTPTFGSILENLLIYTSLLTLTKEEKSTHADA